MKGLFYLAFALVIIGCDLNDTNDPENKDSKAEEINDFNKYLQTLNEIEIPFEFNSTSGFIVKERSENYDEKLFDKFKQVSAERPVGILYNDGNYVVIPNIVIGDYAECPYLMVYSTEGDKLDSLLVFKNSGTDMFFEGVEYVSVNDKMEITVIDSVYSWEANLEGDDRDPETKELSVGKVEYFLNSDGKFQIRQ